MDQELAYRCAIAAVPSLDTCTRGDMAALYLSAYDASNALVFEQDLADKDEVLLLYCGAQLVGFTTLKVYSHVWRGEPLQVLYSGDTVVERQHWGQQALSLAWVRHLGQIKRRNPAQRLVWFLLVKGHRTYRYLHVFAKDFYPGQDRPGDGLAELAACLAQARFPSEYNPATGIVEFTPSRGHLKDDIAEARPEELERPGVAYFLERNPGYRQGHELVCVCDVEESNMKPLTLRLFRQGLHG